LGDGPERVTSGGPPSAEVLDALLERGFRYAYSLTHDRATAEDLLQEACLAVVKAEGRWDRAYLFSAVRTRYINRIRRLDLLVIDPQEEIEARDRTVVGDVLGMEAAIIRREEMQEALAGLNPNEREVLYLAAVEDYTAREIGELTERPRGTVLSLLHRARKKLRKHWNEKDAEDSA